MKILCVLLGLTLLLVCVGCGSNNGAVTGFIPTGNFSNASLSGQYVYQIEGLDFNASANGVSYREAGVFTADGNGTITSSTDDVSEGSAVLTTVSTGTYAISNDGTGSLTLNSALGTIHLAVTMVSASKVYVIEGDNVFNGGGLAEKQDSTAIAAAPAGTFVFKEHDLTTTQSVSRVGVFTQSGGAVSNGNQDVNSGGVLTSLTFTGVFNGPDSTTGRGMGSFTDSSPATSTFIYYIVDANNIRFLPSNAGAIGSARAEKQNGTPTLSGSYAFASRGDTFNFLGGVNTAGRFSASAGSITAGALDSTQDGNVIATNLSFTGTYTQAGSRALVSLGTTSNGNLVVWMVSPSRGFFLVNDPSTVQDGTLDLQTTSSFSNSTMNGQYALVMDGFDQAPKDRVGTLQWDGSGKLTLNAFVNAGGVITVPVLISGSYAVSNNGRAGGSLSGLSNNLVFYLISGTDAYVIQNDPAVQISGSMSKQQ